MDFLMPPLSCADYRSGAQKYEPTKRLEGYLGVILKMENRYAMARVKDIAGELGCQKSSVVGVLKKLEAMGLIVYPSYQPVNLTEEGRRLAEYIGWRNGILVRFFMTVLHLDPHHAMASARRIGYALEDKVIDRMRRFMAETYARIEEPFDVV